MHRSRHPHFSDSVKNFKQCARYPSNTPPKSKITVFPIRSRTISGSFAFASISTYPPTNSFTTNKKSVTIRGVVRDQLPRGHLGLFHLHRHVLHRLPDAPIRPVFIQTRENRMLRHASTPIQHDLHRIKKARESELAASHSRFQSRYFRSPHRTHCIESQTNRYISPPSMIWTGQSDRSLYTCSARVGEICPNLFAEGAAIGSPDYVAETN